MTQKVHIWIVKGTMGTIGFLSVIYLFAVIFQCHPVRFFWLQFAGLPGGCIDPSVVSNGTIGFSVFAAAADIIFGVLPIFVIWNLKMNPKAKVIVGGLLTLGILYVASSSIDTMSSS